MPVVCVPRDSVGPGSVIPGTCYRVLRRLRAGAGGVVYQVEHVGLGRRFALRVLRADLARQVDVVRRARAEWQALARLRHANIARVTDAGITARGTPYAVTEQLPGETLQQRLTRRRSLAVPEALGIARELGGALAAAHAIGVRHGDVALHNVFLTNDGNSKLCDFGNYEPCAGGGGSRRASDVYGLGLVLFEMIAGRPALGASHSRRGNRACRVGGRPPTLAEVVPGVAAAVSELVARLLGPDFPERPVLAVLIAELDRLLRRYECQVSTTQATAHYVAEGPSFYMGSAGTRARTPTPVAIVPLPSQTLEGIPWTVFTPARAEGAHPATSPPVPLAAIDAAVLSPCPAAPAPPLLPVPSGPSPPRPSPSGSLALRLLLVVVGSLLTGGVCASALRGCAAGAVRVSPPAAAAIHDLGRGVQSAAPTCNTPPGR